MLKIYQYRQTNDMFKVNLKDNDLVGSRKSVDIANVEFYSICLFRLVGKYILSGC